MVIGTVFDPEDQNPQAQTRRVMMESMGVKLRRKRRRLGLTLDELSGKTGISKPYLSLIENNQVPNPPSDKKIRKLEEALEFRTGELVTQAHLMRTPKDVRVVLGRLMERAGRRNGANIEHPTSNIQHRSREGGNSNNETRMTNQ